MSFKAVFRKSKAASTREVLRSEYVDVELFAAAESARKLVPWGHTGDACGRSRVEQVARFECAKPGDMGDELVDLEEHVARVARLHNGAIFFQFEIEILYVATQVF